MNMLRLYDQILKYQTNKQRDIYAICVQNQEYSADACSVCMSDIGSKYAAIQCGHKHHTHCVADMVRNGIELCPICRAPLGLDTV